MRNFNRQNGVTLIELMIGMAIGLFVIGGIITVYVATVQSSSQTLKSSRLNQEMGTAMEIMVNDIRRAGFWAGVESDTVFDNPYNAVDTGTPKITALSVRDAGSNAWAGDTGSGNCITYTYDSDKDSSAAPETSADMEFFGFKLDGGALKMRTACTGSSCTAGNAADCTSGSGGTWSELSDPETVTITALTFDLAESKCVNLTQDMEDCYSVAADPDDVTTEIREVDITVTGELVSDTNVKATLNQTIRVRNDLVRERP